MNHVRNAQIVAWFFATVFSALLVFSSYKILSKESDLEDIPTQASEKHEGPKHAATAENHHQTSSHETAHENEKHHEKADNAAEHSEEGHDTEHAPDHAAIETKQTHWSYDEEGKNGPEHWANLTKDNHLCENGDTQSPINITGAKANPHLPHIKFSYAPSHLEIVNNGHTIQANVEPGNYLDLGGDRYELKQFNFHNPSEHKIEGIPGVMEMHLVHRNSQGKTAIVGVVIEESKENRSLAEIWKHLPAKSGDKFEVEKFNIQNALPKRKEYFSYSGSLTTPPCTEGVKWIVLKESISLSGSQVDAFAAVIKRSARPTQNLHGRNIEASNDSGDIASH